MKLLLPGLSEPLEFKENKVYTLVVENQTLLYQMLMDINNQLQKYDGKSVLSVNDKPVDMVKYVELITDFINFDINKKTLLTKIIGLIDENAQNEVNHVRTHKLTSEIESYIYDLSVDFDFNISFDEISFSQILKACNIKIEENSDSIADQIINYMSLVRELLGDRLFILVNLRSFLNDEKSQLLLNTLIGHDYKVLFLESTDRQRLKGERRITIDSDLCEF